MPQVRTILVGMVLLTTSIAGCFGGDEVPTSYNVSASGGVVSDGWAYNGTGLVQAGASIEGPVDVAADNGSLTVTFEAWNSTWEATHASFSGQESYKAGGIAQNLVAHGDTGTASTAIPRVNLRLATWGSAELLRDGEPYTIANGSTGPWTAHLMLSEDTVRGPDGRITKANATGPYDPSTPTNARVIEDDRQAILEFIAPSGEDSARAPASVNESFTFGPGMSPQASVDVPTDRYSSAVVNVSTSGTQGIQAGDIQVRVLDANGTAIAEDSAQITPNQPYDQSFQLPSPGGPTTVQIAGNGTYEATVTAQVTYSDHPFIVITWDEFTLEPR